MKGFESKIKKLFRSPKTLAAFFVIVIFGAVGFLPNPANAQDAAMWAGMPGGAIIGAVQLGVTAAKDLLIETGLKAASSITYAMAYVGGQIISLEAKLMAWLIDISSFTKMPVVQIGWKISRDFANLFFIAILIYLAFSTILKLENSSSIQKTLFKVIVIAVLINFSLMISGMIIDFSQMLFRYFIFGNLPANSKDSASFTKVFAEALRVKDVWTPSMPEAKQGSATNTMLSVFAQLVFIVLFIFIIVIVLGALLLTLLIRNFWLWTLLILAPIAWFCGVVPLPLLSKYSKEWWSHFIKWTFMAPIIAFFVFLSITTTLNLSKMQEAKALPSQQAQEQLGDDNGLFSYQKNKNSIFNPFDMMQMFLVLGFLVAGLFVGNSLGSKVSGTAQKFVTKTGKGVQGYMSRKATQGVGWAGGGALAGISAGLSKVPVVGGFLSKPLGVAGRSLEAKGEKVKKDEIEKAGKRIGGLSLKEINDRFSTFTKNEKVAAIEKAIKAEKMPDNMKDVAMNLAKSGRIDEKALLKIDPTMRSEWQPSIKQIAKLEKDKEALVSAPVKDEAAIQSKEREIGAAKEEFNQQVTKTFKDKNFKPAEISTEVSKLTVSVMANEKIPEGVRDVFVNRAADLDPIKIAATINKITELPQKASFAESILKIRMSRVPNADKLSGLERFNALDPALKRVFIKNPGLREMGFLEGFQSTIKGSSTEEAAMNNKTREESIIDQATKNLKNIVEEVSSAASSVNQQGKESVSERAFKDALQKLKEERKIEAEEKKALHKDIKNKGLDADSLHKIED